MILESFKNIETKNLIIRKATIDDADNMLKNWASNDNVTKYLTWPTHKSVDITKMVLNSWMSEYEKDVYTWSFVCELKSIHEPIGTVSGVTYSKKGGGTIEIGYCFGEAFWGKGYATEALEALIDFYFSIGMSRIEAKHDTINEGSGKVMQKCGMTFEGILRKAGTNNNSPRCDTAVYSILKEEIK